MIRDIHHAQITVPGCGLAEARTFYCDLLGLPEIAKPDSLRARGGFWLQVGSRELHVGCEEDVDRFATKAHLAYLVDDLDEWRARLTAHGVVIHESVPIPGYTRFELRDPFGNRIELIQPTAAPR